MLLQDDDNIFPIEEKIGTKIVNRAAKKLVLHNTEAAFEHLDEKQFPMATQFLLGDVLHLFPKN